MFVQAKHLYLQTKTSTSQTHACEGSRVHALTMEQTLMHMLFFRRHDVHLTDT